MKNTPALPFTVVANNIDTVVLLKVTPDALKMQVIDADRKTVDEFEVLTDTSLSNLSGAFGNFPGHVFPAGTRVHFQLRILDDFFREHETSIRIRYIRDDWRTEDATVAFLIPDLEHFSQKIPCTIRDHVLDFEILLNGEFEHWIGITAENAPAAGRKSLLFIRSNRT